MSENTARVFRVRKSVVSAGSGSVLSGLALGAVAGAAWGLLRPAEQVQQTGSGNFAVLQDSLTASFSGVALFVGFAIAVGLVLGIGAFRRFPDHRGARMELWVGMCALVASLAMVVAGQFVASFRQPDQAALSAGQIVEVLPSFDSYMVLAVAPFFSVLSYWIELLWCDDSKVEQQ